MSKAKTDTIDIATAIGSQVIGLAARRTTALEHRAECQQAIINLTDRIVQLDEDLASIAAEMAKVTGS